MDGSFVCSVLGHLRHDGLVPVGPVTREQIVGYLSNDKAENGGYDYAHIHYGIRIGKYNDQPDVDGYGNRYRGYAPKYIAYEYFYPPKEFIEYYNENEKLPVTEMGIIIGSPANLIVTDPEGFTVTKDVDETQGMFYMEDKVVIWHRKAGNYLIEVEPKPDANSTDTYTIKVTVGDVTLILAEDVPVSDIPTEPYIFNSLLTDLNIDGTVNIVDVSIVAMAFGTKEGDEYYNQIADLDGNEEINVIDLSIVAMDYG